jgi:glucose/arabinose dehydrogenase
MTTCRSLAIITLLAAPALANVVDTTAESGPRPTIAAPGDGKETINHPRVVGWKSGERPTVPAGFTVTKFADGLDYPRHAILLPNGDVVVSEARTIESVPKVGEDPKRAAGQRASKTLGKSANRLTLLRDADGDGTPELRTTFKADLTQPYGMAVVGDHFFVANTDGVIRYPYKPGDTKLKGVGEQVIGLPSGGYNNHWTRNLLVAPDGRRIYVTVGSGTSDADGDKDDPRRAAIWSFDPEGKDLQFVATGLRNPVGVAIEPTTKQLWAAVNERDELGDAIAPDYLAAVKPGAFYGWPYAYWDGQEDPRHAGKRPDLVKKTTTPDYALGAHTASLGLAFADGKLPAPFDRGAFVGQHGSWNRSQFSGYKVVFVPFDADGKPTGEKPIDLVTGFVATPPDVRGRPCGVTVLPDGSLLVMDDAGDTIWRVSATR